MDKTPTNDLDGPKLKVRVATEGEIQDLLYSRSEQVLDALLENPAVREPHLLILLSRRDLPRNVLTTIGRNGSWMSSYAMKVAVAKHPRTPRQIALPLFKKLYLFDLLSVALTPGLSADLRRVAEDAILAQSESIPLGQKRSLAARGSHRLAAGMLLDTDRGVVAAALKNPAMTDYGVAQALVSDKASPSLTQVVLSDSRWLANRPVKLALLRSKHLTLARFASLLKGLTKAELADLGRDPRLARNLREYVIRFLTAQDRRARSRERRPMPKD